MKRIRAYTVIELLVVMTISAISIGIAYTCYTIFSKHYLNYKKNSDELAEFILMDKLLTKDISSCVVVEKTNEGINCNFKKETVRYEFYDDYLLRRAGRIDTFYLSASEVPVFERNHMEQNLPGALIDEVSFGGVYKEEKLSFHYYKQYGADILMRMEESDN